MFFAQQSFPAPVTAALVHQAEAVVAAVRSLLQRSGGKESLVGIRREMMATLEAGAGIYRDAEGLQQTGQMLGIAVLHRIDVKTGVGAQYTGAVEAVDPLPRQLQVVRTRGDDEQGVEPLERQDADKSRERTKTTPCACTRNRRRR